MICGIGIWIRVLVSLSLHPPPTRGRRFVGARVRCFVLTDYWAWIRVIERTKTRPIPNGDVTVPQAVGFLGVQLSAGLAVLTQLNWYRYSGRLRLQSRNLTVNH